MAAYSVESGAQLFARLSSKQRPSLENFYPQIIMHKNDNDNATVQQEQTIAAPNSIEITGECNVGKTVLLMEMISKAILPIQYGGKAAEVLYIVTDKNFQIQKFCEILEKHIRESCHNSSIAANDINFTEIIGESLKNITILKCYTEEEFEITLIQLNSIFSTNIKISLFAIDAIGAIRTDMYVRNLIARIRKCTEIYGITLIYTKLNYANLKMNDASSLNVDYKIELFEMEMPDIFEAKIYRKNVSEILTKEYCINDCGINWMS